MFLLFVSLVATACGNSAGHCPTGMCCSRENKCGIEDECDYGCQKNFGICNQIPLHHCKVNKTVSLTFDDGPDSTLTLKAMSYLNSLKIPATFFQVGNNIIQRPDLSKLLYQNKHIVATHSMNHASVINQSDSEINRQIEESKKAIFTAIHRYPRYFRPPYGAFTNHSMSMWKQMNLDVVTWSIDSLDWKQENNSTFAFENIKAKLENDTLSGHIVLCHDSHLACVEAIPRIYKLFKSYNYSFVPLDECLQTLPYSKKPFVRQFEITSKS